MKNKQHDLLERADRAIKDNRLVREQCRWNLMQAKAATVEIKRTMQWARAEPSKHRQIGLEMAEMICRVQGNPAGKTASMLSDKS